MDLVYKCLGHGCMIVLEKGAEIRPKYKTDFKTLKPQLLDPYSNFLFKFFLIRCLYTVYIDDGSFCNPMQKIPLPHCGHKEL